MQLETHTCCGARRGAHQRQLLESSSSSLALVPQRTECYHKSPLNDFPIVFFEHNTSNKQTNSLLQISSEKKQVNFPRFMSFVPQPQRQNANSQNAVTPSTAPAEVNEAELIFNIRTFDLYFIDRMALMYKDGIAKVSESLEIAVVILS